MCYNVHYLYNTKTYVHSKRTVTKAKLKKAIQRVDVWCKSISGFRCSTFVVAGDESEGGCPLQQLREDTHN